MNRRFVIAWAALFVLSMLTDLVIHGMLLAPDYARLAGSVYRSEADSQQYFGWMLLAHVCIAAGFVWVYRQGREDGKPWFVQGLRYGVAVSVLTAVPGYLIYYAVQPLPGALVVRQIVYSVIALLVMGAAVAWLYRNGARGAAA
ncbi:MAG: hypothetical protein KGJ44_01505 [Betaproteobacteria bacterium]|nr:hypothetical protein [Betaproteobacteria bacterium]